jgi:hypothetical protein
MRFFLASIFHAVHTPKHLPSSITSTILHFLSSPSERNAKRPRKSRKNFLRFHMRNVLSTFYTQKMKILQVTAFGGEKIETVKKVRANRSFDRSQSRFYSCTSTHTNSDSMTQRTRKYSQKN